MRRTRKQLLGLAGLAAVGIMTVVAYGIPAPDAAAEDRSTSGNMELHVMVNEANTSVSITAPRDNSSTINNIVAASTNYSETTKLEYYLTQKDSAGVEQRYNLPDYTPAQPNGTHNFDIDMQSLGLSFGDVQLHAVAYGYGNTVREDTVAFNYTAIEAVHEEIAENRDPILEITLNGEVSYLLVHAYNRAGVALFMDANGNAMPLRFTRASIDPATGRISATLPFEQYNAESGDYTAVVVAYNDADQILSMVTVPIEYLTADDAVIPEVPNTGSLRIGSLNITRLDYLLTGLIAFALVAGFAVFLVCRKNRR